MTSKLTKEQAFQTADNFRAFAKKLGNYQYDNWNDLSDSQKEKLDMLQTNLRGYAGSMYALSTNLIFEDVENSVAQIQTITDGIGATLKKLANVQKVINVAAAFVSLGTAIIAEDPSKIIASLTGLTKAMNA